MTDERIERVRQALVEFHDRTGIPEHDLDSLERELTELREAKEKWVKLEADTRSRLYKAQAALAEADADRLVKQGAIDTLNALLDEWAIKSGQQQARIEELEKVAEAARQGSYGFEAGVEGEERYWFVLEGDDALALNRALSALDPLKEGSPQHRGNQNAHGLGRWRMA